MNVLKAAILSLLLTFFACHKTDDLPVESPCNSDITIQNHFTLECSDVLKLDLLNDDAVSLGDVEILFDFSKLYLSFQPKNDWQVSAVFTHIGDMDRLEYTDNCDPDYTNFQYQDNNLDQSEGLEQEISLIEVDSIFSISIVAIVNKLNSNGTIDSAILYAEGNNQIFEDRDWERFSRIHMIPCLDENNCNTDPGTYRTETQSSWGAIPHGNNSGTYLHDHFEDAFPNGIRIGCDKTIRLSSAQSITDFLPQNGPVLQLDSSLNNPSAGNISTLAGHLVAVELALGFDQRYPDFSNTDFPLGELIIAQGPFANNSVIEFIDIANQAFGKCTNTYDLNEISIALDRITENFYNNKSEGYLTCP